MWKCISLERWKIKKVSPWRNLTMTILHAMLNSLAQLPYKLFASCDLSLSDHVSEKLKQIMHAIHVRVRVAPVWGALSHGDHLKFLLLSLLSRGSGSGTTIKLNQPSGGSGSGTTINLNQPSGGSTSGTTINLNQPSGGSTSGTTINLNQPSGRSGSGTTINLNQPSGRSGNSTTINLNQPSVGSGNSTTINLNQPSVGSGSGTTIKQNQMQSKSTGHQDLDLGILHFYGCLCSEISTWMLPVGWKSHR